MGEGRWLGGFGTGCMICLRHWHIEQLACSGDVIGAGAIGEQPVVANAVEAGGQHVDEEAADELVRSQRHGLVAGRPFNPVVLVFEGDAGLVGRNQSPVGDRDAMGIAREIA
jgi:hypothetical protein